MSEFKTIETQEELDRIVKDRLARQKEKYADYDKLRERVEELETENAELHSTVESSKSAKGEFDKQIADLQAKISGYETEKMKTRVALQSGLPLEFANRLRGDDEDSLKRDAETLAGYMQPKSAAPLKSTEPAVDDKGWGNMIHQLTNK